MDALVKGINLRTILKKLFMGKKSDFIYIYIYIYIFSMKMISRLS